MFGLFGSKKQDFYQARLISSGEEITVKAGENLLKSALEAGLSWPNDCRVGSCGTCKCRLVEGKIKPLSDFSYVLDGDELKNNYILACQSALKTDIQVDVALLGGVDELNTWEAEARITDIRDLTHDIKEVVIEAQDGDSLAAHDDSVLYKAGQYANLKLPQVEQARSYSFATAPGRGQRVFHFYIRHVPGGEFTDWLFDEDRTGCELALSGPYGQFWLREAGDTASSITCVAGGSGMSAIIGLLQDAVQIGVKRDVRFLFGGRTQADLYCGELIEALSADWRGKRLGAFEYIPCLSEEPDGTAWRGRKGLVTEFITNGASSEDMSGQAYLCGPPGMIDAAIDTLEKNGIARGDIYFDKFLDSSTMAGGR